MDIDNKNVWQIIYTVLKEKGIEVYPPATKNGQCTRPYVMFKKAGSLRVRQYSSQRDLYNFFLFVPRNKYDILSDFEAEVKAVLDSPPLYPMIMPTGRTENDYYDDNYNAHLRILQYYNNVRVKHL